MAVDGKAGYAWMLYSGTAGSTPLGGTALAGVSDLNGSNTSNEIDVSTRDVMNKVYAKGLTDASITGTVIGTSAAYAELQSCFAASTTKAWGIKDTSTGGDGFWFDGVVSGLTIAAPVEGAAAWSFTIRPAGAVTWVTS